MIAKLTQWLMESGFITQQGAITAKMIFGFLTPLIAYAVITILHAVTPTRKIKGYVKTDKGELLNYRINGRVVLRDSIFIWFILGVFDIVPFTWLYDVRWISLDGALVIGVIFSFVVVCKHPSTGKSFFADFWFGRKKDPQVGNGFIDAKMWVYLIGAVMVQLHTLAFAAYHIQYVQPLNYGFLLGCVLSSWFCWDYLTFEEVHLYTYDFIAERFGFKLCFGCLTFYPYFYTVSLWFTAHLPRPNHPSWLLILYGAIFIGGWLLTRGANMQKYFFKLDPNKKFLCIKPQFISDGKNTLLVNGYWGAARHINYLGEILQAVAIALAAGYAGIWMVWLYPAYYIGLFISRQIDDDKVCKAKYGDLWDQYTKKVKYRIIPYIY